MGCAHSTEAGAASPAAATLTNSNLVPPTEGKRKKKVKKVKKVDAAVETIPKNVLAGVPDENDTDRSEAIDEPVRSSPHARPADDDVTPRQASILSLDGERGSVRSDDDPLSPRAHSIASSSANPPMLSRTATPYDY